MYIAPLFLSQGLIYSYYLHYYSSMFVYDVHIKVLSYNVQGLVGSAIILVLVVCRQYFILCTVHVKVLYCTNSDGLCFSIFIVVVVERLNPIYYEGTHPTKYLFINYII